MVLLSLSDHFCLQDPRNELNVATNQSFSYSESAHHLIMHECPARSSVCTVQTCQDLKPVAGANGKRKGLRTEESRK